MNTVTLRKRRGAAVVQLLQNSEKISNLNALARAIAGENEKPNNVYQTMRRHIPGTDGKILAQNPLPIHRCVEIARVFGVEPSAVYVKLQPGEGDALAELKHNAAPEEPARTATGSESSETSLLDDVISFAASQDDTKITVQATVSIPAMRIKDQPLESIVLRNKDGCGEFVLALELPISLMHLLKLVTTLP